MHSSIRIDVVGLIGLSTLTSFSPETEFVQYAVVQRFDLVKTFSVVMSIDISVKLVYYLSRSVAPHSHAQPQTFYHLLSRQWKLLLISPAS